MTFEIVIYCRTLLHPIDKKFNIAFKADSNAVEKLYLVVMILLYRRKLSGSYLTKAECCSIML